MIDLSKLIEAVDRVYAQALKDSMDEAICRVFLDVLKQYKELSEGDK